MTEIIERRCQAMIGAGITDPVSKDGIDFCTCRNTYADSGCPYDFCVVVDNPGSTRHSERIAFAKRLREHKVAVADIALILGVNVRRVKRYLKK